MSDVWERYFNNGELFDPENPDHHPDADPDGDGWTNLQESIAGTDPFSGNPPEGMVAVYITHVKDSHDNPSPEFIGDQSVISWDTLPGKRYTLKVSPDLTPQSWMAVDAPIAGDGHPAAFTINLSDTAGIAPDKLFWRVEVEDPHHDTDGDGLTDYEEYLLGSNPYESDTSGDGVPDRWLVVHGYNPNDHHGDILFGDSDLTVPDAYTAGVQDHPDATLEDFDGDGVLNHLDAHPDDPQINWLRAEVGSYALVNIGWPDSGGNNLGSIKDFNDLGHVLLDSSVWRDGNWQSIPQEEFEGSFEIPYIDDDGETQHHTFHYEAEGGTAMRLTPDGGIHKIGDWTASGPGDLEGSMHTMLVPYLPLQQGFGQTISTLDTQEFESTLTTFYPYGGDASGWHLVAKKEHDKMMNCGS